MKKIGIIACSVLFSSALFATDVTNPEVVDGYTIADDIKTTGELRPRFDFNNYDNVSENIMNTSNRFRLNAVWNATKNFEVQAEFLNVSNYSNIGEEYSNYQYVKDTDISRLTIASMKYNFRNADTIINVGRQKLSFNDERLIGTLDWRQLYRSFEAFYLKNNTFENFVFEFAYSINDLSQDDDKQMLALNGTYTFDSDNPEKLNLIVYDYMFEDVGDTLGIILGGKNDFYNFGLNYRGEYSVQIDPSFGSRTTDSPTYFYLNGGLSIRNFSFDLLYSLQEEGYLTPYSTGHKFNGVTDLPFLSTDVQTFSGSINYTIKDNASFSGKLYNFSQDSTGNTLGNEFDLIADYSFAKNLSVHGEIGLFMADSGSNIAFDTTTANISIDYKF